MAIAAAAAKVNLAIAVTGRRPDGYHTLRSVFVRLALHDDLEVLGSRPQVPDSLEIEGDPATPIEGNLVLRACEELRALVGVRLPRGQRPGEQRPGRSLPGLHFRLRKRIPVAAGLAGGSSDAAAALDLAADAWGLRLDASERLATALRVGSDAPFFSARHGAAIVAGIGEHLDPLPPVQPSAGLLLVTPEQRLVTADVFAELDRQAHDAHASEAAVDALAAAMRVGLSGPDLAALAPSFRDANDLWDPAARLSPQLARQRDVLEASLDRPVHLTGSGSTLFAIYPSPEAAARAADELEARRPETLTGAVIIATTTHTGGMP